MRSSKKNTKYHLKTPEDFQAGSGTLPTYKQLGVAFVTHSTTHGVPHSLKARGRFKTSLWLLCLLAGVVAFGVNLTFLVTKYLQYLPSTRITIYNNRTLPFPAVTICNTNPIKSSAVAEDARLVALLESWGVIEVTGNTTRRKRRSLDPDCIPDASQSDREGDHHHISKRASSECRFIKVYDVSDGMSSRCPPFVDLESAIEADCLQAACDYATAGNEEYNVVQLGTTTGCFGRPCSLPFDNSTLKLSTARGGRNIYVRAYNECLTGPCINGQCEDTDLFYQCTCDPGYTGFNCDTAIMACDSGPCDNGGTCQDTAADYTCTCPLGYHGVDCSLVAEPEPTTTEPEPTTTELKLTTTEPEPTTTEPELTTTEPEPTTTEPEPTTTEPEPTTTEPELEPTTTEPEPTTTKGRVTQPTAPSTTSDVFISNFPGREKYREDFLKEDDIISLLAEIDDDTKRKLGYTLNDLVTECDFDGQPCIPSDFSWFFDAVYGNCYVFNSGWERTDNTTDFESQQQGYLHGLTVVLDIGQYEYIQDVGEAAGAVVVVHDPDDMPFPEDEGILAVPGQLTSVGIKKVDVHRLPEPHGECEEKIERNMSRSLFEEHYPVKYSVSSCYITCYQIQVVESCGCGDPQYPIDGKVFDGQEIVSCNARNMTQDDCKYGITKRYINDELDCDCPNPCQQSLYEYKVSSAGWPTKTSEASVFSVVRAKLAIGGVTGLTDDQIKKNLVKIQVFYESHSYERLLEYPAYKLAKLFWDIGGILGLWLGCSVLSIVELLELAVDASVLMCYKLTKRKYWARPFKTDNTTKTNTDTERTNNNNTDDNFDDNNATARSRIIQDNDDNQTNYNGTNNKNDTNDNCDANPSTGRSSIIPGNHNHQTNYNGVGRHNNGRKIQFAVDSQMPYATALSSAGGDEMNQGWMGGGVGKCSRQRSGISLPSTVEGDGNSSEEDEQSEDTTISISIGAANGTSGGMSSYLRKIPGYMLGNVTARNNNNYNVQ